MKKLLLILFLGLIIPATSYAQRYIEVIATEEMEVEADVFTFEFYLITSEGYQDEDIAAAAEKVTSDFLKAEPKKKTIEQQEKEIRTFLTKNGITDNHLVAVVPGTDVYDYSGVFFNENSNKKYVLTLKKITHPAAILHGIDSLGGQRVKLASYKNSKVDHYKSTLALKAMQKAKDQARPMVEFNGDKLGKVLSITENTGTNTTDSALMNFFLEKMKEEKVSGTFVTISYSITVKFEIL